MEGEMYCFARVWFLILGSLSYCYAIGKVTQKGSVRLVCFLPVVCLFLLLPLDLSSVHFVGMTGFFIAWLANFKLLLFAFGKGPLSSDSSMSFTRFLLNACFPIKVQQSPPQISHQSSHKSIPNYAIKGLLLAVLIHMYDYHEFLHPTIIMILYYFHIYFFLELILAILAAMSKAMLGLELEPQFNEPYLSTSLQDFWGKRWNLMATSILRPTVYDPLLQTCSPIVGRRWASLPAILGTFAVSAIMHEVIFYYLGRVKPSWEITWFFLIHGVCLVIEVAMKKWVNRRWRLPWLITTPLTIGFVVVTGFWLFFPPLFRSKADVRAFAEYSAIGQFLKKNAGLAFDSTPFNTYVYRNKL